MTQRQSHFARHMENVWQQLAEQVHGQFSQGGTWKTDKIRAEVEDWTVTLDIRSIPGFKSEELFTRLRAPFANADGFRFTVHPRNVLSRAAAALGLFAVETGYPELEQHYLIHGNNQEKVRQVLADESVRSFLRDRGDVTVELRGAAEVHGSSLPDGADELSCAVPEMIEDLDELSRLYGAFARLLETLCSVVSAYEEHPTP